MNIEFKKYMAVISIPVNVINEIFKSRKLLFLNFLLNQPKTSYKLKCL